MKEIQRLLLAVSFEDPSTDDAAAMAEILVRAYDSVILPIHVVPDIPNRSGAVDLIHEAAMNRLEALRSSLGGRGLKVTEPVVARGEISARILEHADSWQADVILVGSGRSSETDRKHLGTIASHLVRKAEQPVVIAKSGQPPGLRRVLCPIDLAHVSHGALDAAIEVARRHDVRLTVMTSVRPLLDTYLWGDWASYIPETQRVFVADTVEHWKKEQEKEFESAVSQYDFTGVQWRKHLRFGKPHVEIEHAVHDEDADMIIMGSAGRRGFSRFLLGSVAERVVCEIPCTLMIVKNRQDSA